MKKTIGTLYFCISLLILGMNAPSQGYTNQCRGCWADCFNPLLHSGKNFRGDRNCSHCNAFCDMSQYSCSGFCR